MDSFVKIEMNSAIIDSHFLPSLEYFCALFPFDEIILEGEEHFAKQTYRNRSYINTANGVKILTVPLKERHGKILTKDIRIEPGKKWRNSHWRTIESAYRKAPFFEYYYEELKNILFKDHEYLLDLNRDLLSFCLRNSKMQKKLSVSVAYEKQVTENKTDLRSVILDKKPFTSRNLYHAHTYHQVFGNDFVPNLSFIDLLFCEGPESASVIKASAAL
ncbi:MAG TPA: WbqC family protein [Cyclobacteriaceae bacterium]|jgi:hypothetical protein|nr:WbqC family protein [Cyclobacteriaceae bacterium]